MSAAIGTVRDALRLPIPRMGEVETAVRNRIAVPRRPIRIPGNDSFSIARVEDTRTPPPDAAVDRLSIELRVGEDTLRVAAARGLVADLLRPLGDFPDEPLPPDLASLLLEAALMPLVELLERGVGVAVQFGPVTPAERRAEDREDDSVLIALQGPGLRHTLRLTGSLASIDRLLLAWPTCRRRLDAVPFRGTLEIGATTLLFSVLRTLAPGDALILQEGVRLDGTAAPVAPGSPSRVVLRVAERIAAMAEPIPRGIRLLTPFRPDHEPGHAMSDEHEDPASIVETTAELDGDESPTRGLDDLPIRLVFEVGRIEITLGELARLGVGSVLETHAAAGLVDIRANGRRIGTGELVTVEGRAAVRLVTIATGAGAAPTG